MECELASDFGVSRIGLGIAEPQGSHLFAWRGIRLCGTNNDLFDRRLAFVAMVEVFACRFEFVGGQIPMKESLNFIAGQAAFGRREHEWFSLEFGRC